MSEGEVDDGSYVTGVGDEVVVATVVVTTFVLALFIALLLHRVTRTGEQLVHPEMQESVDRTRAELRDAPGDHVNGGPTGSEHASADLVQCPVCLSPVTYPVETNCGHVFCGQCVLAYWRADRWPRACRCPVCRREVTLLLTQPYLERSARFEELTRQIRDYNHRMSGQPRSLISYLYDIPTLMRYLIHDLFTVSGLLCIHRLHILLVFLLLLLYIILPLDILPEAALGLVGLLDDVLILVGVLVYLTLIYRAYVTNQGMM